ncbi:MAG: tail fiber protein [Magnetospirillum sp. WYHS-4]
MFVVPFDRQARTAALALLAVVALPAAPAAACSPDPYVGAVCVLAGNFCPDGYLQADGRSLEIKGNQILYSLLGSSYGGDNKTMFNLPDLRKAASDGKDMPAVKGLTYCIANTGFYPPRP